VENETMFTERERRTGRWCGAGLYRTVEYLLRMALLCAVLLPPGARGESSMKRVELPEPRTRGEVSIEQTLHQRRSVREYAPKPVALVEVAQLLWAAQGITDAREGLRTAPSAGALYPLELFLVAGAVGGLPAGVYRYQPRPHRLVPVGEGDRRQALADVAFRQSFLRDSAGILVFAAVPERTKRKYGERGIRYVYMEAGHAAQNVYLQAVALGLGSVVVGAFDDADVQRVLGIAESPLYLMPFGKPVD
jgi:SagB-type dehydrogenase family enzyme